jgi:hypothetical protein
MHPSRRLLFIAFACLSILAMSSLAVAQSDEAMAERLLGPEWKQLARRAGIVFAVLTSGSQIPITNPTITAQTTDRTVPAIELSFRVDRAIVGVKPGQLLTVREWVGASSLHRAMRSGEHILIFLYSPSRLGFTSPVGGSRGQIALDASGKNVMEQNPLAPWDLGTDMSRLSTRDPAGLASITVAQLERAIRAARGE